MLVTTATSYSQAGYGAGSGRARLSRVLQNRTGIANLAQYACTWAASGVVVGTIMVIHSADISPNRVDAAYGFARNLRIEVNRRVVVVFRRCR